MKTPQTCNTCVGADGKPLSLCEVRATCPDDASSTEKRKETLYEIKIGQQEMEVKPNDQPTQHTKQMPKRVQKHRTRPKNKTKHRTVVNHRKIK